MFVCRWMHIHIYKHYNGVYMYIHTSTKMEYICTYIQALKRSIHRWQRCSAGRLCKRWGSAGRSRSLFRYILIYLHGEIRIKLSISHVRTRAYDKILCKNCHVTVCSSNESVASTKFAALVRKSPAFIDWSFAERRDTLVKLPIVAMCVWGVRRAAGMCICMCVNVHMFSQTLTEPVLRWNLMDYLFCESKRKGFES